jgi:diguanylate cyclase (GGDEF)-like protein
VPVIVGESICGVLQLTNRRSGGPYTARDNELLRIFAAYMSSSIQNALDAIRARALARLDHLTGLFNSRYFHMRLQDEIARADHDGTDLSILFVDLDNFKAVNDRFGHMAGSWTLREVARLLSENAPPATVLARYGGDEFVAILPGHPAAAGGADGGQPRRVIAEATLFDVESEPGQPAAAPARHPRLRSASASYREHLAPGGNQRRRENLLLRLADAAMYRAKANGRNRSRSPRPRTESPAPRRSYYSRTEGPDQDAGGQVGRIDVVPTGGDQALQLLDAAARPMSVIPAEANALEGAFLAGLSTSDLHVPPSAAGTRTLRPIENKSGRPIDLAGLSARIVVGGVLARRAGTTRRRSLPSRPGSGAGGGWPRRGSGRRETRSRPRTSPISFRFRFSQ